MWLIRYVAVLWYSHWLFYCILTAAPSTPPQTVRQVAITATSVTLNWQPTPEEYRNGLIYYVFFTELDSGRSFTLNSTGTSYRIENLYPFYMYNFRVAAVAVAVGSISDNITLQTSEAGE